MEVGCIILAGGKSSRMGRDKATLPWKDGTILEHLIQIAQNFTQEIIIISSNELHKNLTTPCFSDIYKDKGPLGGIYTGLFHSHYYHNLVLSCDLPGMNKTLLQQLLAIRTKKSIHICEYKSKIHPLVGVYDKILLPQLEKQIKQDQLKVLDFVTQQNAHIIDFNGVEPHAEIESGFFNTNTPSEYNHIAENFDLHKIE